MKHAANSNDRFYFRQRALARNRRPDQDARNEAAGEAIRRRVAAQLAALPLIQAMNAAARSEIALPASTEPPELS